jgi:hypothetical protein
VALKTTSRQGWIIAMDYLCDLNEFTKFPYAELTYQIDRKQFFRSLRKELNLLATDGKRMKISELGVMQEEELSKLIPRIIPGTKISFQDQCVWGITSDSSQKIKLFMADPFSVPVFNRINGHKSIGRITVEAATLGNLEPSCAFRFVRGLFLTLVSLKVCLPINIPSSNEKTEACLPK